MEEITAFPCPHCGYQPGEAPGYALAPGTILNGKYLVGKLLGQGGFGLTYIGWDLMLEQKVAIKEYYPSGQVVRQNGASLEWYGTQQAQTARNSGKDIFLKEARKMTRVRKIPQVVQVLDLFLANETAYIVMDFIEGETLKQRLQKTGPLSWQDARDIFLPVIEAMEQVHQAGLIHRDLSPDNLMLQPDGGVQILDLGAAKDLNLNSGVSSMQVAKSGFSPLEQYIQQGGSGTWRDVYSIAATIYYTLTGILPPSAVDRLSKDTLRWDLPQLKALPSGVLHALQKAMAIRSEDRTQTMQELYQGISVSKTAPKPPKAAAPAKKTAGKQTVPARTEPAKPKKGGKLLLPLGAVLACAVIGVGILLWKPAPKAEEPVIRQETTPPTEVVIPFQGELQYDQAAAWEEAGQLGRAAIAFGQLGGYSDARQRCYALWDQIAFRETVSDGVALKTDGTVITASGKHDYNNWVDIVAVSTGCWNGSVSFNTHTVGLKADGTVLSVGENVDGRCDVSKWTDIIQVDAGADHTVGLKSNGTVVAAGKNADGQCDVGAWTDIVAISAALHTVGLKADGTVVAAGSNEFGQCNVSNWTDIVAVAAGGTHTVGLKADGTVLATEYTGDKSHYDGQCAVEEWTNIAAVSAGCRHTVGLKSDGTVVAIGENYDGQCNVDEWTDIVAVCASTWGTYGLKADGTVVRTVKNSKGLNYVSDYTDIKLPVHPALPAYMGVTVQDTDQSRPFTGAVVVSLVQNGAAQQAGIQVNDIIIRLGDSEVSNVPDLVNALGNFKAGDNATVIVMRNFQELELEITFDVRP